MNNINNENQSNLNNYWKILKYANIDSIIIIAFIWYDQENTKKILYHSEFKWKINFINNDFLEQKIFIWLWTNFLSDLKPVCYDNWILEFYKSDTTDEFRDVWFLDPMYLDIFIKQIDNNMF